MDGGGIADRVVECAGFKVLVRLVGRPGPVRGRLLFVNGAITTLSALRWAERDLDEFEVVTFDFPLVGFSEPLNPGLERLSREEEAAIVAALIDRFAPDGIVSLSWGGTSALTAAAERPGRLKRMIVSSFSFGLSPAMQAMCRSLAAMVEAGRIPEAAQLAIGELGERLPARLQTAYQRYFEALTPLQLAYIVEHMRSLEQTPAAFGVERLRRIDCPVLFGNGSRDRLTPPESARPFADWIADVQFRVIEDAGHFLALESQASRERVCQGIRDWFA